MKWQILHRTRYTYGLPARESFNDARLQPAENEHQSLESFVLTTQPGAPFRLYRDFYRNAVHHFEIPVPHSELLIESRALVSVHPSPPLSAADAPAPLEALADYVKSNNAYDFLGPSRFVEDLPQTWRLALDATAGLTDTWQAALALMRFVHGHLNYAPASTHVHTRLGDVLAQRRGVCQDFTHVLLGLCRAVKIPARYVSGYLAAEKARATHAWVEVLIPSLGWRPLDPTHNGQTDDSYVKIAIGRDYADVPPVTGYYKGSLEHKLEVEVDIQPAA
jgi:transglutaminase-like putative cysteine protease